MKVVESQAGRIVVEHEDGYVFVFQIHDVDNLVMSLEAVDWPSIGVAVAFFRAGAPHSDEFQEGVVLASFGEVELTALQG